MRLQGSSPLTVSPSGGAGAGWLSFYIVYHTGNRDRVLIDLVRPLARSLLEAERIESFFFIRYSLGGPHVRLRLRSAPGCGGAVRETVMARTASFLREHPSPQALPEDRIRLANRENGGAGPGESEDTVFADNSLVEAELQPETERYGGPDLLPRSLDFFALSSARVLQLLPKRDLTVQGGWLPIALRLRIRHVLGFARDLEELETLLTVKRGVQGEGSDPIKQLGDQAFAQTAERLTGLIRKEIDRLAGDLSPADDSEVALWLARGVNGATPSTRSRIFLSQLHMTANRLGLRNVDEVYVNHILWRAMELLREGDPPAWGRLGALLVSRATRPSGPDQPLKSLLLARL